MGQIFNAAVYDIKNNICYSECVDKFHANCYSFSTAICSTHYLLSKAPYHVMWIGSYVVLNDAVKRFLTEEKLLGLSVTEDLANFHDNNEDLANKSYYDQVKFIDEHHRTWDRISVFEKVQKMFDFANTRTVLYSGYLINHSKKLAVSLQDYYEKSVSLTQNMEEFVIDPIPPLTETGGGTLNALFEGSSAEVTEQLTGSWCGDLLQIVDNCPEDYKKIPCCIISSENARASR